MRRRGNWRAGFAQRFGRFDSSLKQALTNRHVVWLHAVSVGEVNLCTQLIRALEPRVPNLKIVVSTTTTTGMAELRRRLPAHVSKIYYPVDRRKFVNRALATINPKAIILVEAEIWPNFLWRTQRLGLPVFLVNARLSDRSYPRYKKLKFLFRPLFASFTGVGAQNEQDAARLCEVGCRPAAVRVVGNLKFDAAKLDKSRSLDVSAMLRQLGRAGGRAHSGSPGSTATTTRRSSWLEMAKRLRVKFPKLFLILVPGILNAAAEVGKNCAPATWKFFWRSEISRGDKELNAGDIECLLVNTTGELRFLRAGDRGVRRQEPDGCRWPESDRTVCARQGGGVRAEHAEFHGCDAGFSRAGCGGAGARPGDAGKSGF